MTALMHKAIKILQGLPEEEQDRVAAQILQDLNGGDLLHPFWETATPEERAEAFRQWASRHKGGPGLPAEALRRENMYD